jgi:hypothetical protein
LGKKEKKLFFFSSFFFRHLQRQVAAVRLQRLQGTLQSQESLVRPRLHVAWQRQKKEAQITFATCDTKINLLLSLTVSLVSPRRTAIGSNAKLAAK